MKIKVRFTDPICKFEINENGDCIDLRAAEDIVLKAPHSGVLKKTQKNNEVTEKYRKVAYDNTLISLGVAMQLPKGFRANVFPRSSTYKNFGVILGNSTGIIDESYCGNDDIWKFNAIALRDTIIHKGDRIAQFEIVPSMFATTWQKLKWLFNGNPEFVIVDRLNNKNRGGIGSTGVK